jgi:amidophosphoribosyltransferase
MEDVVQSKCGLCIAHTLHDVYSFIKSLQHRGREACGIFAFGKNRIDVIKWQGGVAKVDLIDLHKIFPASLYHTFGAHVRYATKGREDKILEDAHPHVIGGQIENRGDHIIIRNCDAVAIHNGQVNFSKFQNPNSECDTKILLKYYLKNGEKKLLENVQGSYTLAIADKKRNNVVVMRDRYGIKPGCLGFKDGKYCMASENIALSSNGALPLEDLDPGVIYYLLDNGNYKKIPIIKSQQKHCFFEWNYVSDAQSLINGLSVIKLRQELGKVLAEEFQFKNIDTISFLPRCPEAAARSYAKSLGKEDLFNPLFYKLRGERAFQGTTKDDRNSSIKSNLHILPNSINLIKNKTIILIDDSTIRGNNSRHAIQLLKSFGAKKIILLNYTPRIGIIGSDGIPRGCLWGVDMPPEDDFIVRTKDKTNNRTDEEISEELGAQIGFLSAGGMFRAFERCGIKRESLCSFCIGGQHPFN